MFDRSAGSIHLVAAGDADSLARGLQRLLAALRRRIEAARLAAARRRSARDLVQLEPHLLRDIGLTRNDLRRALRDDA